MLISELISVLIFIGIIIAVYLAEAMLIGRAVRDKFRGGTARRYRSKGAIVIHTLAAAGAICLIWGFFIEPYWVEVRTVEIPTSKLRHSVVRVVQISDSHCYGRPVNEEKTVKIINALKPDVIVFTGDAAGSPHGARRFRTMMKSLEARLAKVAVSGNFDVGQFRGPELYEGTGFIELDANSIVVEKDGEKVWITGLSYDKQEEANDVLKDVPGDCFSIFLHHYPDLAENLAVSTSSPQAKQNIDLYLAGHTHGGQIALPFYGAVITLTRTGKKYEAGMYKAGDVNLYVNRGIGLDGGWSPKARFFARPEITVFEIKPN